MGVLVPKPLFSNGIESYPVPNGAKDHDSTNPGPKAVKDHARQEDLHFIHLTGSTLHQPRAASEQTAVRAHVMRSYLQHREDPPFQPRASEVASGLGEYVGRFRVVAAAGDRRSRRGRRKSKHSTPDEEVSTTDTVLALIPRTQYLEHPLPNPLAAMVSGTNELLEYYHIRYWDNSAAVNPEGQWLAVALTDPAIFHATMCLVALHRCKVSGEHHRYAYFAHRGEAIRIITAQLAEPDLDVKMRLSDSTIGAVSILSSADNIADLSSEVQDSHLVGLVTLVEERGGVDALTTNRHVQRVVSWADVFHAATHNTRPKLRLSSCAVNRDLEPLMKLTRQRSLLDQIEIPPHVAHVLENLRLLGQARTLLASTDRRKDSTLSQIYSSVLYLTERAVLEWGHTRSPVSGRPLSLLETTPGIQGMRAAVLIFTYDSFRNMAVPADFFDKFVARLRMNMDAVTGSIYLAATDFELSVLLWWCVCGWKATAPENRASDRQWFVAHARRLCAVARVHSLDMLKERLRGLAFLNSCWPAAVELWHEMGLEG